MKDTWKYLISLIIGVGIGILINIPSCQKQPEPEIVYKEKHDTITITKDSIIYKTRPVKEYVIDTFYVKESGDTVKLDSIPITEKIYEDTIKTDSTSTEIKIEYSGFNAEINSIWLKHNYFEKQETIVQPPKKVGWVWFIGIGAGVDAHVDIPTKTLGWGPAVGLVGGIGIGGTIK